MDHLEWTALFAALTAMQFRMSPSGWHASPCGPGIPNHVRLPAYLSGGLLVLEIR
jgi:hypothetical protein